MKVLMVCTLVAVALSQPESYPEKDEVQWELFKIEYEKVYGDEKEENVRKEIFMKNLKFIRQHNRKYENGETTFSVGVNKFADLTNEEFRGRMNGFRIPEGFVRKGDLFELEDTMEDPKSVDWRKNGAVTPVKNQEQCGSCWAFSATGSLEGQAFLKTKKLTSLSEQNLVDCSTSQGNQGCNSGLMSAAFLYVQQNQGIDTEASYPYEGIDNICRYNATNKGATCTGYKNIRSGSETDLQQAVANIGPISVAIDASHVSFQSYMKGVYKERDCSTQRLNHAVLVVGYGTAEQGGDYWLVKNSWGTGWGMNGYILMARNNLNMCGIATMSSYPTV